LQCDPKPLLSVHVFQQSWHPPIPLLFNNGSQQWDPLFHHNGLLCSPTVVTKRDPLFSKADWCRYCTHLRSLNLHHFKIDNAMGLKIMTLR
jgi:hypothetical protein